MEHDSPRVKVKTGIIASAGGASRIYPGGKVMPKELVPLPRIPAIANVIMEMIDAGIQRITIVIRKDKFRAIEALLDPCIKPPANVEGEPIVRRFEQAIRSATFSFIEQNGPYGNGTPLLEAIAQGGEQPCVYAFADDVVFGENVSAGLIETFEATGQVVLAAQSVPAEHVSKFGILECARSGGVTLVKRFIEKPAEGVTTSRLASLGRYLITANVVKILANTAPGRGGEIWLSDAFVRMLDEGLPILAFRIKRGRWHTVGNPEGLVKAVRAGYKAECNVV